jgi:hypothetical protein
MGYRLQRAVSTMSTSMQDVTSLMRKEFAAAKVCWAGVLLLQVAALVVAVIAATMNNRLALVIAGSGLFLPMLTTVARSRASAYQERGEQIRKAFLLADGWGRKVDLGLVLVRFAHATSLPSWDTPPIGAYFNSKKPPGPQRVIHILQQSAFFTARHAGTAFWLATLAALATGTVGGGLIWVAAQGVTPFAHATDVGAALLAFAAGGEFLSIGLAYHRLSTVAGCTVSSCEALARNESPEPADLALALSAYDCAVAQAPPIPSLLYFIERDRLERAWATYSRRLN